MVISQFDFSAFRACVRATDVGTMIFRFDGVTSISLNDGNAVLSGDNTKIYIPSVFFSLRNLTRTEEIRYVSDVYCLFDEPEIYLELAI